MIRLRHMMDRVARGLGPIAWSTVLPTLVLLGVLVTAGCNSLLDVPGDPNSVSGEEVDTPGAFTARVNGVQSDFTTGFGQAVAWGGLFTDELVWGGPTRERGNADFRDVQSDNTFVANELWSPLQAAAKSSKDLADDIESGKFPEQAPGGADSEVYARTVLVAAYTRLLLADLFCSTAFDGQGPELSQTDTYQLAEEGFSRVLSATDVTPVTKNAALVGRARVRLQMGDDAGALSDAQAVTEGFDFPVAYSSAAASLENPIWGQTWDSRVRSVDPSFRNPSIDTTSTPDPRVEAFDTGALSFNGNVLQFNPEKYRERDADIRLASWFEAQYIIAELEGGDTARDIINDIRARLGISVQFDTAGTASEQEILAKLLEERGRTFYLEGQRMADLRRFRDRYGIDRYPTGADFGDDVCFPLPDLERANNPDL